MQIETQNKNQNLLRLFSYGMKKSRGKGIVAKSSIDQKNMVINRVFLPFMDSINTDYENIESVINGVKVFFKNRYQNCSRATLKKEKSFILSWLKLNYPEYKKQFNELFSEFIIPDDNTTMHDKSIDFDDISHIISCVKNPKHILFIRFLYFTGARVSEMLNIKIKEGKLSRDRSEVIFKTIGKGNRVRTLRIPISLYNEIIHIFESKNKNNQYGYLFYNKNSKANIYTRSNILKITNKYGDFSCHNLRHSRATHLIEDGVPLNAVSEFLGHSSVLTTAKFYLFNKPNSEQLMRRYI